MKRAKVAMVRTPVQRREPMRNMMVSWPPIYNFRMLAFANGAERLIHLRAYKRGFWAWLARLSYECRDAMDFSVYGDRVELEESGRRHVVPISDIADIQVHHRRSPLWIGCITVWFCMICFMISHNALFWPTVVTTSFMATFWFLYWRSKCFVLRVVGRGKCSISFSVKRGALSGPPLPEEALNEMVECLKGMLVAAET